MGKKVYIKIWIVIVLEIILLGMLFLNTLNDSATNIVETEILKTEKVEMTEINNKEIGEETNITNVVIDDKLNSKNPLNKMFKIENTPAYFLTYPDEELTEGEEVVISEYASDQLLIPLLVGYPSVSYEELGLDSEEEAYQATQLAILEISNRTGESDFYSEKTVIAGMREEWEKDGDINPKIFDVAEDMVAKAEVDAYTEVPTLTVTTQKADMWGYGDGYDVFGPYYYTLENLAYYYASIEIKDEDGNEIPNAEVVDQYGNTITSPIDIEQFFIKVPKGEDRVSFSVTGKGNRFVGKLCVGSNGSKYIYATLIENEMTQDVGINVY